MLALLIGTVMALAMTMAGTPLFIRFLVKQGYGQFIRDDGPTQHHIKRGTPTMGGVVFIVTIVLTYFLAHLIEGAINPRHPGPTVSGLLLIYLMVGMGLIGFLDDFIIIRKQRSLGLRAWAKIVLQAVVGISFAVMALFFKDERGLSPASTAISFVRDTNIDLAFAGPVAGIVLFVLWANLIVTASTNAVNLTDGLDGLATGAVAMVSLAYTVISLWQFNQGCGGPRAIEAACYQTRDPLDLALLGAIICAALVGFLWWNTSPAKIFMGDTGSLALGAVLAGFALFTRTQLLFVVLAGLMVIIAASVIIQVAFFRLSGGKRVFLMAPLQHHFELKGWAEVTVVVRFWIISVLFVVAGIAMSYGEWVLNAR